MCVCVSLTGAAEAKLCKVGHRVCPNLAMADLHNKCAVVNLLAEDSPCEDLSLLSDVATEDEAPVEAKAKALPVAVPLAVPVVVPEAAVPKTAVPGAQTLGPPDSGGPWSRACSPGVAPREASARGGRRRRQHKGCC